MILRLTDRRTGYIDPSAPGRQTGFPSSLGKPGPEHSRFIRSDARPGAFPPGLQEGQQAPGEGSEAARAAPRWGLPGTSGRGHSHGKHTASKRGKLTEPGYGQKEGLMWAPHADPRLPGAFCLPPEPEPEPGSDTREQSPLWEAGSPRAFHSLLLLPTAPSSCLTHFPPSFSHRGETHLTQH